MLHHRVSRLTVRGLRLSVSCNPVVPPPCGPPATSGFLNWGVFLPMKDVDGKLIIFPRTEFVSGTGVHSSGIHKSRSGISPLKALANWSHSLIDNNIWSIFPDVWKYCLFFSFPLCACCLKRIRMLSSWIWVLNVYIFIYTRTRTYKGLCRMLPSNITLH